MVEIIQLLRHQQQGCYGKCQAQSRKLTRRKLKAFELFVPEVHEIDRYEQQFLMELINGNKGKMSADTFRGYCKVAKRMNMERIEREKELEKLEKNSAKSE